MTLRRGPDPSSLESNSALPCTEVHRGPLPAAWDVYVNGCPTATPYHLSGWKDIIERTYGHEPAYLLARQDGNVVGVLPLFRVKSRLFGNSLTSLPYLTYGGLCADNEVASKHLLEAAWRLADTLGSDFMEFRHVPAQKLDLPSFDHKVAMVLRLKDGEESVWADFRPEIRNRIRKAEKVGVAVEEGGAELIPEFYEVFAENMRDLGSPVHSRRFFTSMLEFAPDQVRVVCARLDGTPLAAGITVTFRGGVEMPWVSASRRFQKIAPNNAVYWHAIREACRKKLKQFDFGRSTPGSGTFEFKRRWGAEPVQLHWQYRERTTGTYSPKTEGTGFGLAGWLWRKMPVSLTKILGPVIRRQITL